MPDELSSPLFPHSVVEIAQIANSLRNDRLVGEVDRHLVAVEAKAELAD